MTMLKRRPSRRGVRIASQIVGAALAFTAGMWTLIWLLNGWALLVLVAALWYGIAAVES